MARSLEEIESLRDAWQALLGSELNADYDYFATVLRSRPSVLRPHVVVLEHEGRPRALAVGRVEDAALTCRVGYRALYKPILRAITVVHGGVLGEPGEEEGRLLLRELCAALGRGEAEVLRLRNLEQGSPLHRAATRSPSFLTRQHVGAPTLHWELRLPDSLDALLRSKSRSTREGFNRYAKRLTRELGNRISLEVFREPGELDRLFREVAVVTTKTYQRGLGVAFDGSGSQRALTELAAERGWLRAYVLSVDGQPRAFWHGVAYRGRFHTGVPGYDPDFARLRIGNYVLLRMIEDLCRDESVEILDFGFGDAEYKRRLGDSSRVEEDVLVFAPTFKAVRVNLLRTGVMATNGAVRGLARRLPAVDRVKRSWRTRLRSG